MHITAICPTFRRPRSIPNLIAMFLAQDYEPDRCRLIIYDDGSTFSTQVGSNWEIVVRPERAPSLGRKIAELVDLAMSRGTDAVVFFRDDGCYLPGYLAAHARGLEKGAWTAPAHVLFDNGESLRTRRADRRDHGCWGFRVDAYLASEGCPDQNETLFADFRDRLCRVAGEPSELFSPPGAIEYVYRRAGTGVVSDSPRMDPGRASTAEGGSYEPIRGPLRPEFDRDSLRAYRDYRHGRHFVAEDPTPALTKTGYLRSLSIDASCAKADYLREHLQESEWKFVRREGAPRLVFPVKYLEVLLDDDFRGAEVLYDEPSSADEADAKEGMGFQRVLENPTEALLFHRLFVKDEDLQTVRNELAELYGVTGDNVDELREQIRVFSDRFQYLEYIFIDS